MGTRMNAQHQGDAVVAERTMQDYLDEIPVWHDGTPLAGAPMTAMQWRIWGLAAAGKFFEGFVVFMTGVAMPLFAMQFQMTPVQHGLVGAASLAGILVGAIGLGHMADLFGRKLMFIAEMVIFVIFLMLLAAAPSLPWLIFFLFGLGVALGCDYPTAHLVISESIPSRLRGRMVLSAFGFQAVGALAGTAAGATVLVLDPSVDAWRWMFASAIPLGLIVVAGRFTVTESAHWLMLQQRVELAEKAAARLLDRHPRYPKKIKLKHKHRAAAVAAPPAVPPERSIKALFAPKAIRATVLASVPWFLQDLSTYGIGIFTPTVLSVILGSHAPSKAHHVADIIANALPAARGAAAIDALLIVGIIAAVMLADRVGRIPLQILGFIGCAAGLLIASFSVDYAGPVQTTLIFIGFMLFNFMTNLGPNAQTYLIAGEVFPTHIRGLGAGFAASFAKIGAVMTAFLFPILLADLGTKLLLYMLVVASIAGAVVTWFFRIETNGVNLEEVGH